eukprot:TRINITY_DN5696_c0_g1_i1.p1 TRINITY_DN5696_c0_g1~~TRINITY_DN5696_c0_g1_i1.p1  ORF type:complete len:197 (+),score=-19.13 TRINITY_DN5696_c0_g1_i1:293-883(+)
MYVLIHTLLIQYLIKLHETYCTFNTLFNQTSRYFLQIRNTKLNSLQNQRKIQQQLLLIQYSEQTSHNFRMIAQNENIIKTNNLIQKLPHDHKAVTIISPHIQKHKREYTIYLFKIYIQYLDMDIMTIVFLGTLSMKVFIYKINLLLRLLSITLLRVKFFHLASQIIQTQPKKLLNQNGSTNQIPPPPHGFQKKYDT